MHAGRRLVARAMFGGLTPAESLTHLAVGDGAFNINDAIDRGAGGLLHELGRAVFLRKAYVVEDVTGPIVLGDAAYRESVTTVDDVIVPSPTNLLYFIFRFGATEAIGNWTEYALFGGGVSFISRGATLLDGPQAGDDRANLQVVLGGSYSGADNQTITVTVTTGGASGVAVVGWASDGSAGSGSATATFGSAVTITGTGVTLTFDGGADTVLTQGDQWKIRATRDPTSPTFAASGLYDPVGNRNGQVKVNGDIVRVDRVSPADVKGATVIDVKLVHKILTDD